MKKVLFSLAVLVLLIATLFGCAKQAPTPATTPAKPAPTSPTATKPAAPQPKYGGVLKLLSTMTPMNIGDPAIQPGIPTYYAPAGDSLFDFDKDGSPIPMLATSWDLSPDNKSVTFHLRKGVKFQDGTDFNAQAAKFCLDRGIKGEAPGLKPVTSVDIVDDYTIKLSWAAYDAAVWDSLGGQRSPSWMVSPTSIQTHDKDWPKFNMVGTGPFTLVSYQRDVGLKYEKFKDYWQKGLPYLDRVEYVLVADMTTALMAFKAGEADLITGLTTSQANDLKKEGKYSVIETPGMSVFMGFSSKTTGSPFADIRVRQAVLYAVDTKSLAQGIGGGYYLPANQPYPPWNWGYNPDIKSYPYDPTKAKQLLTEAGYPNGFKTTIYTEAGPSQDTQIAVQANLKDIGITADIRALPGPAINDIRTNSGWDGLMTGQLLTIAGMDPGGLMKGMGFVNKGIWYISIARTDDTLALLDQANASTDRQKRQAALRDMGKLIMEKYAMVLPLYYTQGITAIPPYVMDIGIGQYRYTYEKAWLNK